jgi:hypothetical protein
MEHPTLIDINCCDDEWLCFILITFEQKYIERKMRTRAMRSAFILWETNDVNWIIFFSIGEIQFNFNGTMSADIFIHKMAHAIQLK